jgi:hypothetical protein
MAASVVELVAHATMATAPRPKTGHLLEQPAIDGLAGAEAEDARAAEAGVDLGQISASLPM